MTDCELFKDLKKIELEDIALLQKYFELANFQESNHNVVNLYMWKHVYPLWYFEGNGWLVLVGKHLGEYFLYMPLCIHGCFHEAIHMGEELFEKNNIDYVLSCFIQEATDNILAAYPSFEAEEVVDGFDYIYEFDKLSTFSGKKLQKKRNHLNAFVNEYQYRYKYARMQKKDISECIDFVKKWVKDESDSFLIDECNGVIYLLENFEKFKYVGGIIRIDNKVVALTIGSRLNNDTIQINVEKADGEIRGLYPMITKEYLANEWIDKGIKWVNREDDMGLEYLRKAKESLYPAYLLKKYRIKHKRQNND